MQIEVAVDARNGVGEGPFWDERGQRLWWVDIPARRVFAWAPGEAEPRAWSTPGFPSAVVLREAGGALIASDQGLHFFNPGTGELSLFCHPDGDRPDNRANEAKCDPSGRFWLGTMQNNLHPDGSDKPMTADTGALYCVHPDGRWTREVDGVGLSNTLAWTPDRKTLLFADTRTNVISAFDYDAATGRLGARRVFSDEKLPGYCDGSTIDAEGYLWNCRFAGSCIIRFAPDGRVDRTIELPVSNPTSCCFGGPDLTTLYVTSSRFARTAEQLAANPKEGAVLAIETGIRGTYSTRFAG
jgi:sugar lactone lactonase YvrE